MSSTAANLTSDAGYGAVPTLFLVLSACTVGLRIYVRTGLLRSFLVEDWFCVLTMVLFVAQTALLYEFDGLLRTSEPGLGTYMTIINIVIADVVTYICSSIALKLSLAFFFLRFVLERWHRMLIYGILIIYIMDNISSIFLVLFWCSNPTEYAAKALSGQCTGNNTALNAANILQGVLNALTDWMFAIIPTVVVFRTTMLSRREKTIIASIFAFAVAGSVAAILRTVYWPALTSGSLHGFRTGMTWATIEIGAGLVSSSAATLRPLLRAAGQDPGQGQGSMRSRTSNKSTGTRSTNCSQPTEPTITSGLSSDGTSTPKNWWDMEFLSGEMKSTSSESRRPSCLLPDIEE